MDLNEAVERARTGDADALAHLYRTLSGPLFAFLHTIVRNRHDAEDLLGEVFLSAMRDLPRFSGDASGFRAWLYRIAFNRTVDLARRRRRRPEEPLAALEARPDPADTASQAIVRTERERLWRAVGALPEEQRRVVALRLAAGLTSAEIAEVVGKRPGAVKALQHRALVNLTRALRDHPAYPSEAPRRLDG